MLICFRLLAVMTAFISCILAGPAAYGDVIKYNVEGHVRFLEDDQPITPFFEGQRFWGNFYIDDAWLENAGAYSSSEYSVPLGTLTFESFISGIQVDESWTHDFKDGAGPTPALFDFDFKYQDFDFRVNLDVGTFLAGFYVPGMGTIDLTPSYEDVGWLRLNKVERVGTVPEPSTIFLLATGLIGVAAFRKKSRR